MNPDQHAVISIMVGILLGIISTVGYAEAVFVALIAGTLIDIDHFLVGRWKHGDWRYLKTAFSSFWTSIHDVKSVIDDKDDIDASDRLFTHFIELVIITFIAFISSNALWDVAALSISVHLFSDIYADKFMW